jgi:hypothetical protein
MNGSINGNSFIKLKNNGTTTPEKDNTSFNYSILKLGDNKSITGMDVEEIQNKM